MAMPSMLRQRYKLPPAYQRLILVSVSILAFFWFRSTFVESRRGRQTSALHFDRERGVSFGGTFPRLPDIEDRWALWPPDMSRSFVYCIIRSQVQLNVMITLYSEAHAPCIPKIYVYDFEDQSLHLNNHDLKKCRWSAYNSELVLHELLTTLPSINELYVTRNPEEADFFFVPLFPACYLFNCWDQNGWNQSLRCQVDERYILPILDEVQLSLPYWNRSKGLDHIFVHPMDRGDTYYDEQNRKRMRGTTPSSSGSIYLSTIGDRRAGIKGSAEFRSSRSIVIPSSTYLINSYFVNPMEHLDSDGWPLRKPLPTTKQHLVTKAAIFSRTNALPGYPKGVKGGRTNLAVFRGLGADTEPTSTYSLGIRSLFFPRRPPLPHGKQPSSYHAGFSSLPDFDILPSSENLDYAQALSRAKFGLVPPGHTLDTTRLWEYLAFGVVPVFLGSTRRPNGGLILPFENDLDWASMSVHIPRDDVHRTPEILRAISEKEYEEKRKMVWEVGRTSVLEGERGMAWHYIARGLCRMKEIDRKEIIDIPGYKYYGG